MKIKNKCIIVELENSLTEVSVYGYNVKVVRSGESVLVELIDRYTLERVHMFKCDIEIVRDITLEIAKDLYKGIYPLQEDKNKKDVSFTAIDWEFFDRVNTLKKEYDLKYPD